MDKDILILLVPVIILLFSSNALAAGVFTCLDENTSYWAATIYVNLTPTTLEYTDICSFGCDPTTKECRQSPYDVSNLTIFLIMPIIAFILFYFSSLLKEEDWAIHILLIGSALLFLIVPLGIISSTLVGPYIGLYQTIITISFIIIAYYLIKIIIRSFEAMKWRKK